MTIFNKLDSIISSLRKSRYKPYWRAWNNLDDANELDDLAYWTMHQYELPEEDKKKILAFDTSKSYKEFSNFLFNDTILKEYSAIRHELDRMFYIEYTHSTALGLPAIVRFLSSGEGLTRMLENVVKYVDDHESIWNKDVYKELFGGKYRLVFPAELTEEDMNAGGVNYFDNIEIGRLQKCAEEYFYAIGDTEEADLIRQWLDRAIFITKPLCNKDYIEGKYVMKKYPDKKRIINFGKILSYVEKNDLIPSTIVPAEFKRLVKKFNDRAILKKDKSLVLVISRHPYDIAGMSTDRGWKSCMNLTDGTYGEYVMSSILAGGLIAYLCYSTDTVKIRDSKGNIHQPKNNPKINIQNPLGRCLIKTYYRKSDGRPDFDDPNFLLICSKVYGTFYDCLVKRLQKWLDDNWNEKIYAEKQGEYSWNDAFYGEAEESTYADSKFPLKFY